MSMQHTGLGPAEKVKRRNYTNKTHENASIVRTLFDLFKINRLKADSRDSTSNALSMATKSKALPFIDAALNESLPLASVPFHGFRLT